MYITYAYKNQIIKQINIENITIKLKKIIAAIKNCPQKLIEIPPITFYYASLKEKITICYSDFSKYYLLITIAKPVFESNHCEDVISIFDLSSDSSI